MAKMNEWFKEAEKKVQSAQKDLLRILDQDGENIDCHNPSALDSAIADLVKARSYMAIGRYEETPLGNDILV